MAEQEKNAAGPARVTPCLMSEFPTRHILNNEVHSRPFIQVGSPARCCHMAILTGEAGRNADLEHLAALCRHYNLPTPPADCSHQIIDFGTFRLKWERHTEFCSYTFLRKGMGRNPFLDTALSVVPEEWLKSIPGQLLVGVHLYLGKVPESENDQREMLEEIFGANMVLGALAGSIGAQVWTDFHIHGDGFCRILVNDSGMSETQAGRLVQRLLEIETYRMMAMLAVPLTGEISKATREIEQELADVVQQMMSVDDPAREHEILDRLTRMAARVEHLSAGSTYRFNASKAYYALVEKRIENIREEPLKGFQTISSFLERRIAPAMRTCVSMEDRIANLSRRVNRASTLLQTRINTTLQAQNKQLLESMDRRARLQLRLQQTVEGLSVVAISYYALGIINYLARGGQEILPSIDPYIVTAAAAPIVIFGVFWFLRRLHKVIRKASES
ncbi:DUF3422 domain-containing protein [Emcibacter sp.]|uniref:DUF3422 family protein n=1 Tax=Emcibacter sp. TaxID=1979954 RepID=UPI002AA94058|nr:DUF3422 domain-containing protein [Emcibacter sp.]